MKKALAILVCLVAFASLNSFSAGTNHLTLSALRGIEVPDVNITSVKHVTSEGKKELEGASYVAVEGTIGEHIRFELLLPDAWNGRFAMGGGGGFVGSVQNGARYSVYRGFATVGTDTGHSGNGISASWALDNLEAKVNFGYLAVHRTAEVAKAIIRAYYGKDPEHSYFLGCSRGGGQAMMEAQRYPKDFEGIVAGAPAFSWTGFAAVAVRIAQALYPDPSHLEQNVITRDTLKKLAGAVLEQCDAKDGVKDGIIEDPPSARFDLSKAQGFTDDEKHAIEAIYSGASGPKGKIYPGFAPAAECEPDQWVAWITGSLPHPIKLEDGEEAPDLTFAFGTQIFKYLIFNRADWDYSKYTFSKFEEDTRLAAAYLNATDPDLDGFKKRGGKLIIWHGWADTALPAEGTVEYYRQVQAHDGSAGDYCRLFMVPGCLHCGGGPGASDVDWLSVIVDWAEQGKAPEKLVASKKEKGKIVMTRPLYPYPEHAVFKGAGDPNSADSFEPAK